MNGYASIDTIIGGIRCSVITSPFIVFRRASNGSNYIARIFNASYFLGHILYTDNFPRGANHRNTPPSK